MEPFAEIPLSELDRANQLCNRYESDCRSPASSVPLIESYLKEFPSKYRGAIARELLPIEMAYRIQAQEPVSLKDYQRRFPELEPDWLKSQIEEAATSTSHPNRVPQKIGPYQIQELIGQGGMGSVYRAVHQSMDRTVAIKVLRPEFHNEPQWIERFEREVKASAKLMHPNIVTAFDARRENGLICLVTEWIDGEDLESFIQREGPVSTKSAVKILLQAARGLAYAHQNGVIHRDIKPANLIRESTGKIKLLDMGLACLETPSSKKLTITGMLMGTANFMAPEQARDAKSVDGRSDIYSLGCTLFFLLTARPMYSADSVAGTVLAHAHDPIPLLFEPSDDSVKSGLDEVFRRMVAKKPEDRFSSVTEVIEALKSVGQSRSSSPEQQRVAPPLIQTDESHWRRLRRNKDSGGAVHSKYLWAGLVVFTVSILVVVVAKQTPPNAEKTQNPESPSKTQAASPTDPPKPTFELAFTGQSSYAAAPEFRIDLARPHTFEAFVVVDQYRVSNMVSYIGPQWMALFVGGNQQWGVAQRIDGRSHLVLSHQRFELGKRYHIAGVWDGQSLELYINGERADTDPLNFELPETDPGLFFGGIPPELLPAGQNNRFFSGRIDAVRISGSVRYRTSFQSPTRFTEDAQTLALFQFDEGTGRVTFDESRQRHSATIYNANWIRLQTSRTQP